MVASMRNLITAPLVIVKNTFLDVLAPPPPEDLNRASTEPARNEPDVYETLDFDFDAIRLPARDQQREHPREAAAQPKPPQPGAASLPAAPGDQRTTVLLRNLPPSLSRATLLDLLDTLGFYGQYNFVYLPVNFSTRAGLGYAFVNLLDTADVAEFWATFEGFSRWRLPSEKVCQVAWSGQYQGLEANVEKYRNSAVMHDSIPEEHKPCVLRGGVLVAFPRPTKVLPVPPRNYKRN